MSWKGPDYITLPDGKIVTVLPISGGAIAPLAMLLLPLLPQLIDSALRIYEQIANHPTTPEATSAQLRGYITNIRAINAQIQAAPLPGDEP